MLNYIKIFLNIIRCIPHILMFYFHKNKTIIQKDTERWTELLEIKYQKPLGFIYLLSTFPHFRNVFYNRIGLSGYLLNIFCRKLPTLHIGTRDIGGGLFIKNGFSTAIGATSIGINCTISQQVTIGASLKGESPVILDNVTIHAGAIIIGGVTIGNNTIIGANSTIFKDVPDGHSVYPAPSRVINWNISNNPDSNLMNTDH